MVLRLQNPARSFNIIRASLLCAGALALNACASGGNRVASPTKEDYKNAIGAYANPAADPSAMDPVASAAFWGSRYSRDQRDPQIATNYSAALRKIGSKDQAVTIMLKTASLHPKNPEVNFETGKALIEANRAFEAVRYLEGAAAIKTHDWRILSAYGVALDNIGEHSLARQKYNHALKLQPSAISVMNNKALSYAMSGNLQLAEKTLRAATGTAGADARMRQNLALILAIKGDMLEASRLARTDLPPQAADQNIAYYRSLMTQPAYWSEYAPTDFDAPVFDQSSNKANDSAPAELKPQPAAQELPKLRQEDKKAPAQKQTPKQTPAQTPAKPLVENAPRKVTPITPTALAPASLTPAPSPLAPAAESQASSPEEIGLFVDGQTERVEQAPVELKRGQ